MSEEEVEKKWAHIRVVPGKLAPHIFEKALELCQRTLLEEGCHGIHEERREEHADGTLEIVYLGYQGDGARYLRKRLDELGEAVFNQVAVG